MTAGVILSVAALIIAVLLIVFVPERCPRCGKRNTKPATAYESFCNTCQRYW
jgi:hypothetical protein